MNPRRIVVKVGGSLFDLPHLGPRLRSWLEQQSFTEAIIIPGGGIVTDAIRELDKHHRLGQDRAHWLALRSLTLNAWFLAELLPDFEVLTALPPAQAGRGTWILDPYAFAVADDQHADAVPRRWDATSDTLAARVATVIEAEELVLLKSRTMAEGTSWRQAVECRLVDPLFPGWAVCAPFAVRIVNLRAIGDEGVE